MKDKNRTVIASIFVQEDPRVVGEPSLEIIAGEFVALHNEKIIEWHELSSDDDLDFFLRATESNPGEDNGMGELVFEISGEDSHTGNPILFEVPASLFRIELKYALNFTSNVNSAQRGQQEPNEKEIENGS